jgi:hypothetical protein
MAARVPEHVSDRRAGGRRCSGEIETGAQSLSQAVASAQQSSRLRVSANPDYCKTGQPPVLPFSPARIKRSSPMGRTLQGLSTDLTERLRPIGL